MKEPRTKMKEPRTKTQKAIGYKPKAICLLLITFSLLLSSCGGRKATEPLIIEKTKTIEKKVRDTIVTTLKDSVRTILKIECPDGGKPIFKTQESRAKNQDPKGDKHSSTSLRAINQKQNSKLKIDLKQNGDELIIDCKAEAEQLALKLYDTYVKEHESTTKPIYIEKPFKWYHKALMWVGGITLIAFGSLLIAFFFKPKI